MKAGVVDCPLPQGMMGRELPPMEDYSWVGCVILTWFSPASIMLVLDTLWFSWSLHSVNVMPILMHSWTFAGKGRLSVNFCRSRLTWQEYIAKQTWCQQAAWKERLFVSLESVGACWDQLICSLIFGVNMCKSSGVCCCTKNSMMEKLQQMCLLRSVLLVI